MHLLSVRVFENRVYQSRLIKFLINTYPMKNANQFLFLLACYMFWSCQPPAVPTSDSRDQCPDFNVFYTAVIDEQFNGNCEEIDRIVNAYMSQNGAPNGMAVGIVKNNQIYYLKGYGFANVAEKTPFTYATPSVVGSISKTITALGILNLVEEGIIDLDAQASTYLPANTFNNNVTVRELLSHASGLPMWPDWDDDLNTEEAFQEFFNFDHPAFLPRIAYYGYHTTPTSELRNGTASYSNAGFTLLGAIIDYVTTHEVVTNPSFNGPGDYERYTWYRIGVPMKMYSMCLYTYWRTEDILNLSVGYHTNSDNIFYPVTNPDGGPGGWRGPAGGWSMTVGDLCRLMIGLNTHVLLSENLTSEMFETSLTSVNPTNASFRMGLGILRENNLGETTIMHLGNIDGYTARYTLWPERNFGIAILTNEDDATGLRQLSNDLANLFSGITLPCLNFATATNTPEKEYLGNIMNLSTLNGVHYQGPANNFMNHIRNDAKGRKMLDNLKLGKIEAFKQQFQEFIREQKKKGKKPDGNFDSLNEFRKPQ